MVLPQTKAEHPFLYLNHHFSYSTLRNPRLTKSTSRIALLLGFSRLLIAVRYATP